MTIKTILVHVDDSRHAARTIRGAHAIAQGFDARLDGFYVVPDIAMAVAAPGGMTAPSLVTEMQKEAEERAATAQGVFEQEQASAGFAGAWHRIDALGVGTADAVASVAHYADLLVIGQRDPDEDSARDPSLAGDLIAKSGRPVLMIPHGWDGAPFGRRILVGWKQSREAARAAFDALPFLERAEAVVLASVADERHADASRRALDSLSAALAAHGVATTADVLAQGEGSTSETLLAHAASVEADMLVTGGYSHSRLREGLFGGVTRSIIERSPYPTLLSH